MSINDVDVVVIGAGLSGLVAARDLVDAGMRVRIVEARDRFGGRLEGVRLDDGYVVQGGAEVLCDTNHGLVALIEELGLPLTPAYNAAVGKTTWDMVEGVTLGDAPDWMTEEDEASHNSIEEELAMLASQIDIDDPWAHPEFGRLDAQSVGTWARSLGATPGALRMLELEFGGINAGRIDRVSLMGEARRRAALPSPFTLAVEGGTSRVIARLAEQVGSLVQFGATVRSISGSRDGVAVRTAAGESLRAESVISTMPTPILHEVEIDGPSPELLAALRRRRHALMAKVVMTFEEPFWLDLGVSGMVRSEDTFGTVGPSGDRSLFFMMRPEDLAHHLGSPPGTRAKELLAALRRIWGADVPPPVHYLQRDWAVDPFTKGAVAAYSPGDLTAIGRESTIVDGPIFFAGSDQWACGYLEGAVQTGRQAAANVLARLGHQ